MSTGETTGKNTGNLHAGHPESNLGLNLETICITNWRLECKLRYGQTFSFMHGFYAWAESVRTYPVLRTKEAEEAAPMTFPGGHQSGLRIFPVSSGRLASSKRIWFYSRTTLMTVGRSKIPGITSTAVDAVVGVLALGLCSSVQSKRDTLLCVRVQSTEYRVYRVHTEYTPHFIPKGSLLRSSGLSSYRSPIKVDPRNLLPIYMRTHTQKNLSHVSRPHHTTPPDEAVITEKDVATILAE